MYSETFKTFLKTRRNLVKRQAKTPETSWSESFFPEPGRISHRSYRQLGRMSTFQARIKSYTHKIYVLVRGSAAKAITRWTENMPMQIGDILATKKVHFVMVECVTVIVHGTLKKTVMENCIPALELAQLAGKFKRLTAFVHISTAYVNSFLPDGVVEEKIYELGDAEKQLCEILDNGTLSRNDAAAFPVTYAFGKHLTERLLVARNPDLPLLIVRPTAIGPAISQPYRYYGPIDSLPLSTYIRSYMQAPDSGVSTRGVIHAGSQSYISRSLLQLHDDIRAHFPHPDRLPPIPFRYVSDGQVEQGRYATFWGRPGKDWIFSNTASKAFSNLAGPLGMALEDHDAAEFMRTRAKLIAKQIMASRGSRL
ncbi:hypothetical protein B0H13DRAFT_2044287 [Mycena leptocephala]|nr:hypothetical protein B0H13DRAFT_2044287 [Mycena leptocephala]